MSRRPPKLRKLLETVADRSPVLVVTHDNPDPDALASAAALRELFRERARVRADIAYGGRIGRAENRAMVQVLGLPVVPLAQCNLDAYPVLAIVDFQHTFGNHSLPPDRVPDIAIDHHPVQRGSRAVAFCDYRSRVGATCTIVCDYLFAMDVPIHRVLATALCYGIKSETNDFARDTHALDIETFVRLYPLADKRGLAHIEMAPVTATHYAILVRALSRARVYGDVLVITELGPVPNGETTAEMADVFLRLEGLRCAVALARHDGHVLVSVRTLSPRDDAGLLVQRVFGSRGSAGGHATMAAGRVSLDGRSDTAYRALERELVRGFRSAFGVETQRGRRLVPKE